MKGRKKEKNDLPEHLKAILRDVGVKDVESTSVEVQLQQRAAAQVRDYLHIMTMKLSRFSGPRETPPVAALSQILHEAASGKRRASGASISHGHTSRTSEHGSGTLVRDKQGE